MSVPEDIFEHINRSFYDLTKSEKLVAQYILAHRDETQYMSITDLATEAKVADATISRFCRKLGLQSFNAFKLALARATCKGPTGFTRARISEDSDELQQLAHSLLDESLGAMEQTLGFINPKEYHKAVELLETANHVFCMGQGGSMVLAEEAYSLFLTISPRFSMVRDSHLQMITTALLGPSDVIFFFSYSGSTADLMDLLTVKQQSGCKLILVTRFPSAPGAHHADVILQCGSNESVMRSGSVPARVAQLLVIDLLFQLYYQRNSTELESARTRAIEALSTKML